MMKQKIEISTGTIVRTVMILLGLWFLYLVRDIVAIFLLSVILTATLGPTIDYVSHKKISRSLSVILIYIGLFFVVGAILSFLIPPLIGQIKGFAQSWPVYSEELSKTFSGIEQYASYYGIAFNSHEFLQNLTGNIFQSSGQLFSTTVSVLSFFISMLAILALTFYMSVKEDAMKKFLTSITPQAHHDYVESVTDRIKAKIGKWLAGQLLLMVIIFVLDFVSLSIFRIPYALILAMLAGLLEIVPYLGPIISATLASLVGFLVSPVTGLIVLGILTIIQQLESHIIAPQVMKKAVGLNPVAVILSLLIGAQLGGTLGAILAIPLATSLGVVLGDLMNREKKE